MPPQSRLHLLKHWRRYTTAALLPAAAIAAWLVADPAGRSASDAPQSAARSAADATGARHGAVQVDGLVPSPGGRVDERGPVRIAARLGAGPGSIDPAGLVLRVDGLDVTDDAFFDGSGLQYYEYLPAGSHKVELLVRDRAGQVRRVEWSFLVVRGTWDWPVGSLFDGDDFADDGWPFWGLFPAAGRD